MEPHEIKSRDQWDAYEVQKWLEAVARGLGIDALEFKFRQLLLGLRDRKRDG